MQLINTHRNNEFKDLDSSSSVLDFFQLMKPRVMSLVVFTAFVGMILSPIKIHPFLMFLSLLSIAVGAGAAGAFNQFIDKDVDKIMNRTRKRPIPSGKIEPAEAFAFASVFSIFSIILIGLSSNWKAAFLLGFTIFFYVVIYSIWLKYKTSQNIVIGGAAGALPPLIGWFAMGGEISFVPIFLFLLIFFWTPPHFWTLAILQKEDYKNANIPMLPITSSEKYTRIQIVIYSLLVFTVSMVPSFLGYFGKIYFLGAIICNLLFSTSCFFYLFKPSNSYANKVFYFSIFYLFSMFALLLVDYFTI